MAKRPWTFVALVVVFSLVVMGCAGQPAATQAPAAEQPAAEEFEGELTFWSGYPEMAPLYDFVIADFEAKHPGVKVNYLTHPLREYEQKLAAAIPTDTGPDVFEGSLYANLKFIELGMLPEAPQAVLDAFPGAWDDFVVDYNTVDGKRYGIPFFEGRPAYYISKACLEEAGLDVPPQDAPLSWDQFTDMIQKMATVDEAGKVTRAGISLRLSGGASGIAEKYWIQGLPFGLEPLVQTADGKWKAGYNTEAGAKTIQFYLDTLYKWNADSYDLKHDAEGFELGDACMFQRETWVIGDIALKAPDLEYTTIPMPRADAWQYLRNSFSIYVTKSTENPDLAWEFAQALVSPEAQIFMLENVGWLPSRADVDYSAVLDQMPAFKAFMVNDPDYTPVFTPKLGVFDEIWTKLAERLQQAYLDPTLVDNPDGIRQILDDAAAETNDILAREGLLGE